MIAANQIVDRVNTLPALPDTAVKLMTVINDPRSNVADIVETIMYDQAITAKVLRLCNSAYFGASQEVYSLNDAMARLGTIKVLLLVISVHMNSLLDKEHPGYGLRQGFLWRHSVGVALASVLIAKRINIENKSLAFTAGLLHDIGKVVLSEYVAAEFATIMSRVTEEGESFSEAEKSVLGFSHEEIGGMIAEAWNLPTTIVNCIRYHHEPQRLDPFDPLVETVYLANVVCLMLGIGLGDSGLYSRSNASILKRYDLQGADLQMVGAEMLIDLQQVEEMFSSAPADSSQEAESCVLSSPNEGR